MDGGSEKEGRKKSSHDTLISSKKFKNSLQAHMAETTTDVVSR